MSSNLEYKVIYSKHFPRKSVDELLEEVDMTDIDIPVKPPESFKSLINRINEESTYSLNEDKQAGRERFIDLAIELSSAYEIDVEIKDCSYYVTVAIYLDCATCSGNLKSMFAELISMSDRISSFIPIDKLCDFIIVLDYYTHDHFVSGRKVDF